MNVACVVRAILVMIVKQIAILTGDLADASNGPILLTARFVGLGVQTPIVGVKGTAIEEV